MRKGVTIWITGLHCSGKTTLANRLADSLKSMGYTVQVLDGKDIRGTFTPALGFDRDSIRKNLERIIFECKLVTEGNSIAIAAVISPYADMRKKARTTIKNFIEVHCEAPIEILKKRDTSKFYERAEKGEIKNAAGVNAPYERPEKPEVHLDTSKENAAACEKKVLKTLEILNFIRKPEHHIYTDNEEDIIKDRLKNLGYI